jgi:hypothetical protein
MKSLPKDVPQLADIFGKDDVSVQDDGFLHPVGQDLHQGQLQQSVHTYTQQ